MHIDGEMSYYSHSIVRCLSNKAYTLLLHIVYHCTYETECCLFMCVLIIVINGIVLSYYFLALALGVD